MGKSTISMAIINCYVSSPEGKCLQGICFFPELTRTICSAHVFDIFFSSKAVAQGDMSCCSQDTMIRVCLKYGAPKTHGLLIIFISTKLFGGIQSPYVQVVGEIPLLVKSLCWSGVRPSFRP